jgi:hypothetical protein
METIRFDLRYAHEDGYNEHPQKVMESLGIKILKWQGEPIADAIFMQVENLPDTLPKFITLSKYTFD